MSQSSPLAANDVPLALNARPDRALLTQQFNTHGRIHIPNILTPLSAERLLRCLTQETKWNTTFNNGPNFLDVENMTRDERTKITLSSWQRVGTGFQYLFDNHRLTRNGEPYADPAHYYAQVVAFMNSPALLSFVREVTGLSGIAWADAQATLYRPGDFLTVHDDEVGGHKRLAAYVLNMTPGWRPEWGGVLQFVSKAGHLEDGYVPCFNGLNIFRVPCAHFVSMVAPFGGMRYSVTGWFHGR